MSVSNEIRASEAGAASYQLQNGSSICLVYPENPGPLDQVRDFGLRPENAFEIAAISLPLALLGLSVLMFFMKWKTG